MNKIGNRIVDDSLMEDYSYLGKGQGNKDFSKYKNVKSLICQLTLDAYNNYNDDKITLEKVDEYFRASYIRLAKQRYQRSQKKKK